MIFKVILFTYVLISSFQINDIEGVWVTQDDETGKKKSEILLYKNDGRLYGKILNLLLEEDKGKKCVNCKGGNKNLLIEGMTIVDDLKLNGKREQSLIQNPEKSIVVTLHLKTLIH